MNNRFNLKYIRSVNDLFYFICLIISIPFNFILTYYAHSAFIGFQTDAKSFRSGIPDALQLPANVFQSILFPGIMIVVLVLLFIHKRYIDILISLFSILVSYLFTFFCLQVIIFLKMPTLLLGYIPSGTISLPVIPAYIVYAVCLLIIYGKNDHYKLIRYIWWSLYGIMLILLILSSFSIMSAILAVQIGALIAFLMRTIFGQINNRIKDDDIIKFASKNGLIIDNICELTNWNNSRCRYLIANVKSNNSLGNYDRQVKDVFLQIYDYDRGILNFIDKIIQFIKYKNVRIKNTNPYNEYEHNVLMNFLLVNSGMNQLPLLKSLHNKGSSIFIFDNSARIRHLNEQQELSTEQISQFFDQINLAHSNNISFNEINVDDLVLINNFPAIVNTRHTDHNTSSIFKRFD